MEWGGGEVCAVGLGGAGEGGGIESLCWIY